MNSQAHQDASGEPPAPANTDWVAVYQSSMYVFAYAGEWRKFALNGEEGPMEDLTESVTLITAWNPHSEERSTGWNEGANGSFFRKVVQIGLPWAPAWGSSLPDVEPSWREEGFALFGLNRSEAASWGRDWGQRAVVFLAHEHSELIFCDEELAVSCGMRRYIP